MSNILSTINKYSGFLTSLSGVSQQVRSFNIQKSAAQQQIRSINVSGDIEYTGGILSAEGYRKSITSIAKANAYNLSQDNINIQREMQSLSTNFQRTIGAQITQTAAQGVSLTSKSALMLRNETSNIYEKALLQLKLNAENNTRNQIFETKVRQSELEQQARGAEFQAQLSKVQAANRAAEIEFGRSISRERLGKKLLSSAPTLLGQLFKD